MLQLSIENISLKFDELHQLKANNWKPLTPPEIQVQTCFLNSIVVLFFHCINQHDKFCMIKRRCLHALLCRLLSRGLPDVTCICVLFCSVLLTVSCF